AERAVPHLAAAVGAEAGYGAIREERARGPTRRGGIAHFAVHGRDRRRQRDRGRDIAADARLHVAVGAPAVEGAVRLRRARRVAPRTAEEGPRRLARRSTRARSAGDAAAAAAGCAAAGADVARIRAPAASRGGAARRRLVVDAEDRAAARDDENDGRDGH